MSRRLLASYLGLALVVLVALVVPLGLINQRSQERELTARVERDAATLASIVQDRVGTGRPADERVIAEIAERYQADTGGRVVVVDRQGVAIVDSDPPEAGRRTFETRPEIRDALAGLVASGTRHSDTLDQDLLYVAVPIAAGGVVRGAVRVSYPTSTVDERVTRYWLALAAIAAVVLLATGLLGSRFARSISRPLRDLQTAAASAGAGDLSARAPAPDGPPEVRAVATAFNEMVAKLDALVDSQEAFVADASHQLRSPLTALRLRLENLERDVAPEGRAGLEGALAEVGRLSRLVDGLLVLARADRRPALPEEVALATLVAERVEAWGALAEEGGRRLRADVPAGIVVRATPGSLEQVLDNLIANAIDASPEGGTVSVTAVPAGSRAEIHVADQGPGMDAEARAHAFDRFWRAGREAGFGLGLAIVHRLVRADGGEVVLLEAPGGGLDACVRLPAVPAARDAAQGPARRGR